MWPVENIRIHLPFDILVLYAGLGGFQVLKFM